MGPTLYYQFKSDSLPGQGYVPFAAHFPDVALYGADNDDNVHDDRKLLSRGDMTMTLG